MPKMKTHSGARSASSSPARAGELQARKDASMRSNKEKTMKRKARHSGVMCDADAGTSRNAQPRAVTRRGSTAAALRARSMKALAFWHHRWAAFRSPVPPGGTHHATRRHRTSSSQKLEAAGIRVHRHASSAHRTAAPYHQSNGHPASTSAGAASAVGHRGRAQGTRLRLPRPQGKERQYRALWIQRIVLRSCSMTCRTAASSTA